MKKRLDQKISSSNKEISRTKIQSLIKNGDVLLNGKVCLKNNFLVSETDEIKIKDVAIYVSRAAQKLISAIEYYQLNLENLNCLDIGSSTGGFTQVMLENNANFIYAIDVGTDQMDSLISANKRVELYEKTNFKNVSQGLFSKEINFITCDVSFISSKIIIKKILELFHHQFSMVLLIKPQFELGKNDFKGVIKDSKIHKIILNEFKTFFNTHQIKFSKIIESPIKGKEGNIEYLVYLEFNHEK